MTGQIGLLRGMASQHFPGALYSLSSTANYWEVRSHPEYLALHYKYLELKEAGASKALINAARYKIKTKLRSLISDETKRYRAAWIRDEGMCSLTALDQDSLLLGVRSDSPVLSEWQAEVVNLLFQPIRSLEQSL
jgi:hypothetical protein